ncbi:MAG: transketolase [Deltaproteobacteria bacterium RIFCSPLOWO2_02_FULL_53_8]|nr:MAG: transketolase [Deltaproteobacteria bacterium RIFCSPLOWO2_02_FULL_53_8]
MRDAFVGRLLSLAQNDPRIVLVTGDLGFGVLEKFSDKLPKQYVNAGVAEQNMTGLAAGMALDGKIVFTYSIANFPTLRALEQIRNDAAYHDANVKVVAIGGGFSYGALGMSHHATEDLAIIRALPQITMFSPGCLWEAEECAEALVNTAGTCYLRLDKSSAGRTNRDGELFAAGKLRQLRFGGDAVLLVTGGILGVALQVADMLLEHGIKLSVYSAHSLRPFDEQVLIDAVRSSSACFTLEEHVVAGGLGGLVAETCMEAGVYPKIFHRFGLRGGYSSIVGSQDYLRQRFGLDATTVSSRIRQLLQATA